MKDVNVLWVGNETAPTLNTISYLKLEGYEVILADNTRDCLNRLCDKRISLIILDKSICNTETCSPYMQLRNLSYIPIIVLGEREEAAYVLELGADSFVSYPLDAKELKARINALIRRGKDNNTSNGNHTKSPGGDSHAKPSDLTQIEQRITSYLQMNKGQVIDYKNIIQVGLEWQEYQ
ncbi:response regulator transcription factor [Dehalococcoides mccartyi]|uniref:response regulator transcription factor n=1 Tax=Dehalococcoides mccartyi TaxID=61435 RepID=UPI00059DBB87|nr:response regulator [Dehalococcoides mccartyi]